MARDQGAAVESFMNRVSTPDACGARAALARAFAQVWRDALDLTQTGGDGDVECYFHYTTELGFRNITHASKAAVEVFVLPLELLRDNALNSMASI